MPSKKFSRNRSPVICFAHRAYKFSEAFSRRNLDFCYFSVCSIEELEARIDEVDVLVISGLWENKLLQSASKLKFVQSISAGVEQYDIELFKKYGVLLASGKGGNSNAVSQHVMAVILSFSRQLHLCRDNQIKKHWREMIGNPNFREDELSDKTMLIVGFGNIGKMISKYASVFGMRIIATRRHLEKESENGVMVYSHELLPELIPSADVIVLACPLTDETTHLFSASEFKLMRQTAYFINVSRGKIVDEEALVFALKNKLISGAGVDVMFEEPLPKDSPLWSLKNVILTPHTAGETRRYEDNILDILIENLKLLDKNDRPLLNQVLD